MTLYEQAVGFVATLACVSGFVGPLVLHSRAGRVAAVAVPWVLTIAL